VETILVIAAEARELSAFALRLGGRRRVSGSPLSFAEEGEFEGRRWILAADGPGPALAASAAREFAGEAARVVSTGYCGALDPALVVGDVVICNRVIASDSAARFQTANEFGATCLSGDRVIQTSREKQYLRETTGASVVEMEAAGVAAEASGRGLPFHCIKVVTDTANEDMTVDFNAARGEDGRFRLTRIVASALRRPTQRIPELVELNKRARQASEKLGAYLGKYAF
jgi:adenosylhomocysteine nucleosidase